jgi:hypothetical protein
MSSWWGSLLRVTVGHTILRTWWQLLQKSVARTKLDIYGFIVSFIIYLFIMVRANSLLVLWLSNLELHVSFSVVLFFILFVFHLCLVLNAACVSGLIHSFIVSFIIYLLYSYSWISKMENKSWGTEQRSISRLLAITWNKC